MTVYELIQELAQNSPDTDIMVSFENDDIYVECDGSEFAINKIGHRIYIEIKK